MGMIKIMISGEIGWDVTPSGISKKLDSAGGSDLDVHIVSPGGYVSDGIEIYNMFRDYKRKYPESQMMATIKGVAASMATYLAVNPAFDLIVAEDNAVFMIHNVWGDTVGDYRDMLKSAEVFQGLTGIIANAYEKKTGIKNKEIRKMMDDESWFFGEEIKQAGFVDEIIKTDEDQDREQSLAIGRLKFKNLSEKLKSENSQTEKIAAMMKVEPEGNKEKSLLEILEYNEEKINTAQIPAKAGKNILEVTTMETLAQLMATNPAAKIEMDSLILNKGLEQFEAGRQSVLTVAKKASAFAKNEEYHKTIRGYAVDVMSGEKSLESLEALVIHADMIKETSASSLAKIETGTLGDTAGEQTPPTSVDGTISNPSDFMAEIARSKSSSGVEVR